MRLFNVIAAACLAGFAGMCGEASAKVKLPALFSDGMVMQQGGKAPIWGESDKKNGNVTVKTSWNGKEYAATVDAEGRWKTAVETPAYGGHII